jgi:hypothetical protein
MVTERRYKNALVVIEQYKKEQEELRQLSLQKEGITLDADIHELNSKGLVSDSLTYKLYQLWNWERAWNSNPKDFTLNLFTDLTNTEFSNHRGVGKKTLDEFIKLMAAAGHTVL